MRTKTHILRGISSKWGTKTKKKTLRDKKGYYANKQGHHMTKTWHYKVKQNVSSMRQVQNGKKR